VIPPSYRYVEAWGMSSGAYARVLQPTSVEEIRAALALARREGRPIALRGTGNSYGDASTSTAGLVLDCSRMDAILDFDQATGVATLEPGVTVRALWRHILPLGWWPRVVSGTSFPTIAGAAAMNIHGKNNFAVGTIGDAIQEFDLVLPSGEVCTCSRERERDLFHAAIGGFGMLGVMSRIQLATKRIHSGELEVHAHATKDLAEMMDTIEAHKATADYLVGWVDCFARGDALGRGQIHRAQYLREGEDPHPERTLTLAHQEVKTSILGFPKGELWRCMRLFAHDPGWRAVCAAKYWAGRLEALAPARRWTHVEFAFLLDYVPNWKWAYGRTPGRGLIQFQPFVPKETAHETFCAILRANHAAGHVPYLGVFKRHRPDPFWLTHAVDGWSLAMDFKVTPENRRSLWAHCTRMADLVLAAGGRFYFAKDSVLGPDAPARMYAPDRLDAFLALKRALDPEELLQTDLWRRVFARHRTAVAPA
jgi:FAD/FMN-containing dehydrogenase